MTEQVLAVTREDVDRAVKTYLAVPYDKSWPAAMRDVLDEFVEHKLAKRSEAANDRPQACFKCGSTRYPLNSDRLCLGGCGEPESVA